MERFRRLRGCGAACLLAALFGASLPTFAQSKWTLVAKIPHDNFYHATWTGKEVLATGYTLHASADGLRWKQRIRVRGSILGAAFNGHRYVAVGGDERAAVWISEDANNWRKVPMNIRNKEWWALWSVTWADTQFVAVGTGGLVLTSPNGEIWTPRTTNYVNSMNSVIWADTQLVAAGQDGIIISKDGVEWTVPENGRVVYGPSSVIWTGTRFVAVGGRGLVMTSTDARHWDVQSIGQDYGMNSVVWTGRQCVAVGNDGSVYTSLDGEVWTVGASGFKSHLESVVWTGKRLVAVGYNGVIITANEDIPKGEAK